MLAMDVNDNAGCLDNRVALAFIASMLAPTLAASVVRNLLMQIARIPCLFFRHGRHG
jgi:hypothetical protein